jgi:hypothetical protein
MPLGLLLTTTIEDLPGAGEMKIKHALVSVVLICVPELMFVKFYDALGVARPDI